MWVKEGTRITLENSGLGNWKAVVQGILKLKQVLGRRERISVRCVNPK